jgi:hypothetical protein
LLTLMTLFIPRVYFRMNIICFFLLKDEEKNNKAEKTK